MGIKKQVQSLLVAVSASVLLLGSVQPRAHAQSESQDKPDEKVKAVLQLQEDAWNKGDLNKFLSVYETTKDVSMASGVTEIQGFDEIKKRYVNRYGTKPGTMGHLSMMDLQVRPLGKDFALCIGRYEVTQGKKNSKGLFSLILKKDAAGEWKILHDHTSAVQ